MCLARAISAEDVTVRVTDKKLCPHGFLCVCLCGVGGL